MTYNISAGFAGFFLKVFLGNSFGLIEFNFQSELLETAQWKKPGKPGKPGRSIGNRDEEIENILQ